MNPVAGSRLSTSAVTCTWISPGPPFEESYQELCATLAKAEAASVLGSLSLRSSADEGSNGTRNWDLSSLVEPARSFPSLRSFSVEQNGPGDHNRIVIGDTYYEAGVLGKLMRKAPSLDALTVPSAPDATFFTLNNHHPLRLLSVNSGYDTQGFIGNLANSSCFPGLRALEFGEYNETYMEDFTVRCTPFEDYRRLFRSQSFAQAKSFVWRNPICSEAEIAELRSLRPNKDLIIKIVQFSQRYV
jgi:hypothetical protein